MGSGPRHEPSPCSMCCGYIKKQKLGLVAAISALGRSLEAHRVQDQLELPETLTLGAGGRDVA